MKAASVKVKDHNVKWISVKVCWINVTEISTDEKLSPAK
jgi:hypothetical protein